MSDTIAIAALIISILIPLIIWGRRIYIVGPELVIEIKRSGSRSKPRGVSSNNEYVNGEIEAKDALHIYELEWEFEIIIRNNSEHTAYNTKIGFQEKQKPFTRNDGLNQLTPRKSGDEIILKAYYTTYEECLPTNRTKTDILPENLKSYKILLEYANASKTKFYTMYDSETDSNIRLRQRPKGFVYNKSGLSTIPPKKHNITEQVSFIAAFATIISTMILLWQVFKPVEEPALSKQKIVNTHKPDSLTPRIVGGSKSDTKDTSQPRIDTRIEQKYDLSGSIINSAVGDNAKVTNNYGANIQRSITPEDLTRILQAIPSKQTLMTVIITSHDTETLTFGNEILQKLISLGYNMNKELSDGSTAFPKNENIVIEGTDIYVKQQ